jgi:hypothetical protein
MSYTKLLIQGSTASNEDAFQKASTDLKKHKESLNKAKSRQDPYSKNDRWIHESQKYEVVTSLKHTVKIRLDDQNITGAWLKYYELCLETGILSLYDSPRIFFNGELPGAGLLATWQVCKTLFDITPEWKASSLLPKEGSHALKDSYGLYKTYPAHWTMNQQYPGDLTSPKDQDRWKKEFKGWANIYMCDAAQPANPNTQEQEHYPILNGAIQAGINIIQKHGSMIVKLYTIMEPETIKLVADTASRFKKSFLYKPITSKQDNSEVYLVCIDKIKQSEPSQEMIDSIVQSQIDLAARQIQKLIQNIEAFEKKDHTSIKAQNQILQAEWLALFPLRQLPKNQRLIQNPQYGHGKLGGTYHRI